MSNGHYPQIRLFVEHPLSEGAHLTLTEKQAHYLVSVMRKGSGDGLLLFNGRDGEWLARIGLADRKHATAQVETQTRPHLASPDLWLVFAPIKHTRLDHMVEKATELGVSALFPAGTQHAVARGVNRDRLAAHCMEAAEQCGRLDVPVFHEEQPLRNLLAEWPKDRALLYCDESGGAPPATETLDALAPGPLAVLTGPEGGFSREEFEILRRLPFAKGMGLGPRILRADTAAIAALAVVQSRRGDWDRRPAFRTEA